VYLLVAPLDGCTHRRGFSFGARIPRDKARVAGLRRQAGPGCALRPQIALAQCLEAKDWLAAKAGITAIAAGYQFPLR